jgi:hypothetical protein
MKIIRVLLSDIQLDNQYRISRYSPINDLIDSIKKNGILEPPILLKNNGLYDIISGHRRIEAALLQGYSDINAFVWNEFDYDLYVGEAAKKMYHKSAGVIGRIKAFCAIAHSPTFSSIEKKIRQILHIPNEIDADTLEKTGNLPSVLLRYLDEKDAALKLVLKILSFDDEFILLLENWAEKQCRFSLFRIAIDMYSDIRRDDRMMENFVKKNKELNVLQNDDEIIKIFKEIRYPAIEVFAQKADDLKKRYARHGADLTIPVYEEGKQPGISISIKWSDRGASYRKTLEFLRNEKIEDILSLL